jgi:hypothetical protein
MAFDAKRSASSGRFLLEVGDSRVAFLKEFSGLNYEADIVNHDHGSLNMQSKNMANYKFTPGKASIGMAMGKEMHDWIKASFKRQYATKSGAFIAGDFNYKETHRVNFQNALITSVGIQKLSGDDKSACYFDVEFDAEDVRHVKGTGQDIQGNYGTKTKAWLASCFRFELSGLEDACKRVASIDAFQWKQSIVADTVGETRIPTKHPAKVVVPNLKLAISSADQEPWRKWAEDWFVNGKCLSEHHKDGALVFLAPDMKQELGRITLKGCGLSKFGDDSHKANAETIKRFNVELYIEEMDFDMQYTDA